MFRGKTISAFPIVLLFNREWRQLLAGKTWERIAPNMNTDFDTEQQEPITYTPTRFVKEQIDLAIDEESYSTDEIISEKLTTAFVLADISEKLLLNSRMVLLFGLFVKRYMQILEVAELDTTDPLALGLASLTFNQVMNEATGLSASSLLGDKETTALDIKKTIQDEVEQAIKVLNHLSRTTDLPQPAVWELSTASNKLRNAEEIDVNVLHAIVYDHLAQVLDRNENENL